MSYLIKSRLVFMLLNLFTYVQNCSFYNTPFSADLQVHRKQQKSRTVILLLSQHFNINVLLK